MIFTNLAQRQIMATLLLILFSFGVFSASNDNVQTDQRGKVIRPIHEQTHPNQRVALVIGNGAYHKAPLPNPPNDSDDMAMVLEQVGFEVKILKNASLKVMETAIQQFGDKTRIAQARHIYSEGFD